MKKYFSRKISTVFIAATVVFVAVAIPLLIYKYQNAQKAEMHLAIFKTPDVQETVLEHGPLIHVELVPLADRQTFLRGYRDELDANFSIQFQLTNKGSRPAADILIRTRKVKFPIDYPSKRKDVVLKMAEVKSLKPNETILLMLTYTLGFDTSKEAVTCLFKVQSGETKMRVRLPIIYSNPGDESKFYKTVAIYDVAQEGGVLLKQVVREKSK